MSNSFSGFPINILRKILSDIRPIDMYISDFRITCEPMNICSALDLGVLMSDDLSPPLSSIERTQFITGCVDILHPHRNEEVRTIEAQSRLEHEFTKKWCRRV